MKTVCVYHSIDLDGWMSAAIVKHWFLTHRTLDNKPYIVEANTKYISIAEQDAQEISFIGYTHGDTIPDLSEYDKIIMCDISFPMENMFNLFYTKSLIWNDHHVSSIKDLKNFNDGHYDKRIHGEIWGLRDTKFSACELTWKYFFPDETMPELVRLLGRYDCFGHKDTEEELKVLRFQYGARAEISNYEEAYDKLIYNLADDKEKTEGLDHTVNRILYKGLGIYEYLCTEAKQTYKNGFDVILENKSVDFSSRTDIKMHPKYKFIFFNKERFNPINFGIHYHNGGYDGAACFHFARGVWNFSLYNDNGLVDCSVLAKQFGGGGHKGAAGFVLDTEGFLKLISNKI